MKKGFLTNKYLVNRYILFLISLFINAFGVSFITKAMLGTSPITSVNFVLSMFTPLTMGQWTIIVNLLFVALETILMTRDDFKNDLRIFLLQIPISLCFGTFIDWSMNMLFWLTPTTYIWELISLFVGCFILAVGIAIEVKANVAMASGEYLVQVISRRFHKDFGYTKLAFDISQVVIACALSIAFMSGIKGVREGTVIAALAVGPIVHFITPYLRFLDCLITPQSTISPLKTTASGTIITIAREFGSGGHLLGEMLAKELGIKLYDKSLIHLAAQNSGMDENYIRKNEQSIPSFWLKCIQNYSTPIETSLSRDDILFVAESKIIQEIASQGTCIIVGRLANFILKDRPHVISIFCYTDKENAIRRCIDDYGVKPDEAETELRRVNRNRATHYEYYTGERWSDPHKYDLMINTDYIGFEEACRLIKRLYLKEQKNID